MQLRVCPLCGRDNRQEKKSCFSQDAWSLKTCPRCHLVFLENVLPYETLVSEHAWTRSSAQQKQDQHRQAPLRYAVSARFNRLRWQLTRRDKVGQLIRLYVRAGVLLDVGCGKGEVLSTLGDEFTPWGIEIDERAASEARTNLQGRNARILQADALSGLKQLADGCLDGAVMISYLEHENQPLLVLREMRRVLRDSGAVIIKVPNFASVNRLVRGRRWCGFRHPDHVNYFTPQTLQEIVQLSGLEIRRFWLQDRLPTSDNMWLVAGKAG